MITDLFNEGEDPGYLKTRYYWLNGDTATTYSFLALVDQVKGTKGELTLDIYAYVDSISFAAPGYVGNEGHEFSVGGIYTSVPEPSTLLLLSTGLLVGAAFRKRLH